MADTYSKNSDAMSEENLRRLVKKTKDWKSFFDDNITRYHMDRKFVFKTTLDQQTRENLGKIQKPPFEFNVTESYISRLRGEFSKQEPSFTVGQNPDGGYVDPKLPQMMEGHLMHKLYETRKRGVEYCAYTDQLAGGWSVFKVTPDYESAYTFNQTINIERCFDPTMCGFDPLAQEVTKYDGQYSFEIIPMTEEAFYTRYQKDAKNYGQPKLGDYSWSYTMGTDKIILVCEMYVKKTTPKRLVYLANNVTMFETDYNKAIKEWSSSRIEQPPKIIQRRMANLSIVCRYEFTNDKVMDYAETTWTNLPHVFVDGNSMYLREDGQSSESKQVTRSYFYHAKDAQILKNIAGQTLANELEGLVQAKYIAPLEGIPEQYIEAYTNIQKPSNLIYRAYMEDGTTPIPPPQPVQRAGMPQEVLATFMQADQTIQNILGAFNTQLGVDQNDISGKAIVEAMTQSNASGMPYIVNFMLAWNQVATIYVDLFPKVYLTPRTIPILDQMRNSQSVAINGFGGGQGVNTNYSPNSLSVEVEAGMNFEVQKNRAIAQMATLGQAFPALAQLINTKGLPLVLDNLDFRGADTLKQMSSQMMQEQAQQPPQPTPISLKMQDLAMRNQHKMADLQLDAAKLKQDQIKLTMDYQSQQQDAAVEVMKTKAELAVHSDEMLNAHLDRAHELIHKGIDHAHATMHKGIDHGHARGQEDRNAERAEKAEKEESNE